MSEDAAPVNNFVALKALISFVVHSRLHGDNHDKAIATFITNNFAKSVLISNSFLMVLALTRFLTYRNSYLLYYHAAATVFGIRNATIGVLPVWQSYAFDRYELASDASSGAILTDMKYEKDKQWEQTKLSL